MKTGVTRGAAQRVDHSRFKVTPAKARSSTRRARHPAEDLHPRPQQEGEPSKIPSVSPHATTSARASTLPQTPAQPPETNSAEEQIPTPTPMEVETPTPASEETAQSTESKQADQHQSVCRGHYSEQLERMDILERWHSAKDGPARRPAAETHQNRVRERRRRDSGLRPGRPLCPVIRTVG